jgi:hypothetical protein
MAMHAKAAPANADLSQPEVLAMRHMLDKNLWLVRIRWIYPLFIMAFFLAYRFLARSSLISLQDALLVLLLPVCANFLFRLLLRRKEKTAGRPPEGPSGYNLLGRTISLQLGFDLLILALIMLFSGGLESPVIALMILYIMISTFLVDYRGAFRITLAPWGCSWPLPSCTKARPSFQASGSRACWPFIPCSSSPTSSPATCPKTCTRKRSCSRNCCGRPASCRSPTG